ncbi:MAG: ornithine cyclodeaminase family protein, partial [Planctomycetota bacterium]
NGYLTHVRTGLAGAVAARHLANEPLEQVAILGCGTQARFQLDYLRAVRRFERLRLWDRRREAAEQFAAEIGAGMDVEVVSEPQAVVVGSDCIVTVTPSRQPFVLADWVGPGAHVTAVGADDPGKQELDEALFARADVIVADSLGQCLERGELHHAVDRQVIKAGDVRGELGAVIAGKVAGRTRTDEISICDLTGVGVQDAAIAAVALQRAETLGLGRQVDV